MFTKLLEKVVDLLLLTPKQYQTYPLGALLPLRPSTSQEGNKLMPHTTFSHNRETTEWVLKAADQRLGNQIKQYKLSHWFLTHRIREMEPEYYCRKTSLLQTLLDKDNNQWRGKMALAHFTLQILYDTICVGGNNSCICTGYFWKDMQTSNHGDF